MASLYRNKLILAPMVRIGTLPTRLLSLTYGANLVYTEEIIDFKLLRCQRIENELFSTVDYITNDGVVVFRTCKEEKDRVILQLGTADAGRALKAAKLVEKDVAGIDVNMGCPKEFSLKGGMGAALLTHPEKIREILTTLVNGLSVPVSCKIRILPSLEDTQALVRLIASTGVSALAVHGRTKDERSQHCNHNDVIRVIAKEVASDNLVVIANGGSSDISTRDDLRRFAEATGCSSVMVARAAEWNHAVFSPVDVPFEEMVTRYVKQAILLDNEWANTKYCLQQLLHLQLETDRGKALMAAKTLRDICVIFGQASYFDEVQKTRSDRCSNVSEEQPVKRRKLADGCECLIMDIGYHRRELERKKTPKMLLYEHSVRQNWVKPTYLSEQGSDRMFESKVKVNGLYYASTMKLSSKRITEQAAARVCLKLLGINEEHEPSRFDRLAAKIDVSVTSNAQPKDVEKLETVKRDPETTKPSVVLESENGLISECCTEAIQCPNESEIGLVSECTEAIQCPNACVTQGAGDGGTEAVACLSDDGLNVLKTSGVVVYS